MAIVTDGMTVSEGDRVKVRLVEGSEFGSYPGYWYGLAGDVVRGTVADVMGTVRLDSPVNGRDTAFYFNSRDHRYELVANLTSGETEEDLAEDSPDLQVLDRELEDLIKSEDELGAVVLREGDPVVMYVVLRYSVHTAVDLNRILCALDEADLLEHTAVEVGKFEEVKGV